jgi:hypothetical protein
MVARKSRFSNPTVLSIDACPIPLTLFLQGLPFVALASRVLNNETAAVEWMLTPALALGDQRPMDVLSSNAQFVESVLLRLQSKVNKEEL